MKSVSKLKWADNLNGRYSYSIMAQYTTAGSRSANAAFADETLDIAAASLSFISAKSKS